MACAQEKKHMLPSATDYTCISKRRGELFKIIKRPSKMCFLVFLKQTDDKEIRDQWTHLFNQISTESNIRFFGLH